jgi:hypothetical protein
MVTELFLTPAVVPVTLRETAQVPLAGRVPAERLTAEAPAVAVAVPPHVFESAGVPATTSPAGKLSVNARPVRARLVFGLVILNVSEVVLPVGTDAAPKALVIDGGVATVRFAEAVLPVPPLVEVTAPVVLVNCPAAAPVTVMLNWHWLFAATVAPVVAIPVGAVVVTVPPQTVADAFATINPVGSVSVKATPVRDTAFTEGFVIVKVTEVVAFSAIDVGLKAFVIDGGATTLIVAVAVPPVPPSFELMAPVVLLLAPAMVPVMLTEKVHEPLVAIVPPESVTPPEPAVAVIVPDPHVPVKPLGVETTKPAGRVSLKATPLSAVVVFGFVTVKLRLVEPFRGMLATPNDLLIVAAPTTVTEAFDVLPVPAFVELTVTLLFFTPAVVP